MWKGFKRNFNRGKKTIVQALSGVKRVFRSNKVHPEKVAHVINECPNNASLLQETITLKFKVKLQSIECTKTVNPSSFILGELDILNKYLDKKSLKNCCLVNKTWYGSFIEYIWSQDLWTCIENLPVKEKIKTIDSYFTSVVTPNGYIKQGQRHLGLLVKRLNIVNLSGAYTLSPYRCFQILQACRNLEALHVQSSIFSGHDFDQLCCSLKNLTIKFTYLERAKNFILSNTLVACPKIDRITFYVDPEDEELGAKKNYPGILQTKELSLNRKLKRLQLTNMHISKWDIRIWASSFFHLTHLYFDRISGIGVKGITLLCDICRKLEYVDLRGMTPDGKYCVPILLDLPKLHTLSWYSSEKNPVKFERRQCQQLEAIATTKFRENPQIRIFFYGNSQIILRKQDEHVAVLRETLASFTEVDDLYFFNPSRIRDHDQVEKYNGIVTMICQSMYSINERN